MNRPDYALMDIIRLAVLSAIVAASAIAKAEQKAGVTVVPTVPPSFAATHHVRID